MEAGTIKERDVLQDLYLKQGLSAAQIAKKLKLSERTVYARLKMHGISKPGSRAKYSKCAYCKECGRAL